MVSMGAKIKKLGGMVGTGELKERDNKFVSDIVSKTDDGRNTGDLTDPQINWLDDLHKRHFE